jgi:uncharacterized protein (UPF0332 family)
MKSEELEYIGHRLSRAEQTLGEAELMIEHGYLSAAVNRLYYACFYSVSALLLTEGQASAKHSGVRALFDRDWINTGRLPAEMGRFYRQLFSRRQKGDYDDLVTFDRENVDSWLQEAKLFVAQVSEWIKKNTAAA